MVVFSTNFRTGHTGCVYDGYNYISANISGHVFQKTCFDNLKILIINMEMHYDKYMDYTSDTPLTKKLVELHRCPWTHISRFVFIYLTTTSLHIH